MSRRKPAILGARNLIGCRWPPLSWAAADIDIAYAIFGWPLYAIFDCPLEDEPSSTDGVGIVEALNRPPLRGVRLCLIPFGWLSAAATRCAEAILTR
jgi:hypothetical protein